MRVVDTASYWSILFALTSLLSSSDVAARREATNNYKRNLQTLTTTSCLAASNFTTTFTHERCTPNEITQAISLAMAKHAALCNDGARSTSSELASLLGLATEDFTEINTALQAKCEAAFQRATLPFSKITRKGDAFDREFFSGGSDWNDQYQISLDGTAYHNLQYDASRIMYEIQANTTSKRPMEFPSYLPQFDNCAVGAVMCCHVSDRQSNNYLEGSECKEDEDAKTVGTNGDECANDPVSNTDVCVASMEDAQISNRVQRGLAVYHLTDRGEASEGNVNCHGFAWDLSLGDDGEQSWSSRYRGNMLFDVAFKQSLYDKGYVKNVPGAPMCGCIEQMPTVTRSDCTKITSIAETYTLSATVKKPLLSVQLADSGVQYGPCDHDGGEDLASYYKSINAGNNPDVIDSKLVGEGNCLDAIDSSVQAYGYKRSVLEITEAYFIPSDAVNPTKVIVKFNTAVSDAAATMGSFKVYDSANPALELDIASSSLTYGNAAVELALSSVPSLDPTTTYQVSNVVTLHKRVAPMVTLETGSSPTDIVITSFWDKVQIGQNWKLAQMIDNDYFSVSSRQREDGSSTAAQTSMIYQSDGTLFSGPRDDYNAWSEEPTYSTSPPKFGDKTLEIDNTWRIRQVDEHYLSITHLSGRIVALFRKDGERFPKWHIPVPQDDIYSGYATADLGAPSCAFLTDKFLQLGDWRIGEFDSLHLSLSHKDGMTSFIYKRDGTAHPGPRLDFSTWNNARFPIESILQGTTDGCDTLFL